MFIFSTCSKNWANLALGSRCAISIAKCGNINLTNRMYKVENVEFLTQECA